MRTITTTFFSTLDREQTYTCLKFLLFPWKWKDYKKGKYIAQTEDLIKIYIGAKKAVSFYNGRAALYFSLKTAGVREGDEVIIQAYTCVTVPNAVIEAGAKPIYCDVDESLNIDPIDLKAKITSKTKAVIIQHTFGMPARIEEIKEAINQKNICRGKIPPCPPLKKGDDRAPIVLIEDCAHSLGAKYNGKPIGSFGDISMFSFGRDKVISSVNGGMLCVNNEKFISAVELAEDELGEPPVLLIVRNLLYPVLAEISLKWYNKFNIGKIIMYVSKKLRLFPLILDSQEKEGVSQAEYYRMPNVLAYLFIKQFKKLDEYNEHRRKIAKFYDENLKKIPKNYLAILKPNTPQPPSAKGGQARGSDITRDIKAIYLRYTIFTEKAGEIIKKAKKENIYMGDWYRTAIAPKDINLAPIGYEQNMCSKAEHYAALTINLPNHPGITLDDAKRVADFIKKICPARQ